VQPLERERIPLGQPAEEGWDTHVVSLLRERVAHSPKDEKKTSFDSSE